MAEEQAEEVTYTIYKTATCVYCAMVGKLFKQWGRRYRFYDITDLPEKRLELQKLTGATTVPLTFNDNTGEWVVGFNAAKLKSL